MLSLLYVLVFFTVFALSLAENANITVEDDSPLVIYSGEWFVTEPTSDQNSSGSYHASEDKTAWASFDFTGVAVSFLAPKWPYKVGVQLTIDSDPSEVVDLRDYTQDLAVSFGNETFASSVVWSKNNLNNTRHSVWVSFPEGDFDAVVFNTFVIISSSSRPFDIGTVVGIIVGVMAALGLVSLVFFLWRKRADRIRERRQRRANSRINWILLPKRDVDKGSFDFATQLSPMPARAYFPPKEQQDGM